MRIVLTGPESTGKTSLALILSNYYKCTLIPEQVRFFLHHSHGKYVYNDLNIIAQAQLQYAKSRYNLNKCQLEDTDLLTILIWSKLKFGTCDPWLYEILGQFKPDLYLLCMNDLPWVFDPFREDEFNRATIAQEFIKELNLLNVPYFFITGSGQQRISIAQYYINSYTKTMYF